MFDDESYYSFKVCQMLIANSDLDEWVYNNPSLCTSGFLMFFSIFINKLVSNNFMSPIMKSNALNFLNLVRFNDNYDIDKLDDVSKEIRFGIINELIRKINLQDGLNYLLYYRQEMYKRTNNKDYLINSNDDYIMENESKLLDSIMFDHFVLLSHSNGIDDTEFDDDFLPELVLDDRYLETINCILEEYPNLFFDNVFFNRYHKTINNLLKNENNMYIITFNNKVISKTRKLKNK